MKAQSSLTRLIPMFGLLIAPLACGDVPTETQQSDAPVTPLFKRGGNKPNPNREPDYSADLNLNPGMDFMDDGNPAYIDGEQHFGASTKSDGYWLLVNFSKGQKRKGVRRAWLKLGCKHPSSVPLGDDSRDTGPSGQPCSPEDYELVEVTDMRAWFHEETRVDVALRVVDRCPPWNDMLFDPEAWQNIPDRPDDWIANALAFSTQDPPAGAIRKRRVFSTPNANLGWCRNPITGLDEYWHVDFDFEVTEH